MISATSVKNALHSAGAQDSILVQGWVRTRREAKTFSFVELNDSSSLKSVQIIAPDALANCADVQRLITGASVAIPRFPPVWGWSDALPPAPRTT